MSRKPIDRDQIRLFRARRYLTWAQAHPMHIRPEMYEHGKYAGHGITNENIWYDTYPTINRLLRDEMPGLAVTHYRHPSEYDGSRDFWWITGDPDYQRAHVARLLGHAVTRFSTMANDAKVETMQNSANPDERRIAGDIIDIAQNALDVKSRFDLMPIAQTRFALSDADLLLLRGWAHQAPSAGTGTAAIA